MPDFRITVTQTYGTPDGTTLLEDGRGLRLPNGDILKPWVALELNEEHDLTGAEMDQLHLDAGIDVERSVEPLGEA